jgi:hypothetical protein
MKPSDFPCTLEECNPGHILYNDKVYFKTEYRNNLGRIEAYCDSGEFFCVGPEAVVTPLIYEWEEI